MASDALRAMRARSGIENIRSVMSATPADERTLIEFLGMEFDSVTVPDAVDRMERWIEERRVGRVACVNVALLVWARSSRKLSDIYKKCDLLVADGMGIYYGSRLLGRPTPGITNAVFLLHELIERAAAKGYRVYLLGTRSEILERAVAELNRRYPRLTIVGYRDGFFSADEEQAIVCEIVSTHADILVIGISSVRKDEFLDRHLEALGVPVSLGVGGALDVIAGVHRLAPSAVRRAGLEWVFRLAQEPRRLWRRYLVTNFVFGYLVVAALVRRAFAPHAPAEGRPR